MKKILALLLMAAVSLAVASPVFASDWNLQQNFEALQQALQESDADRIRLQRELQEALRTPRPQPTPRPPQSPNIRLVGPQSVVLAQGEVRYIDITVRNIGNGIASNALLTASTDGPFSIEFLNDSNILGHLGQGSTAIVRTRLTFDGIAEARTYFLDLQFAFRSRDGNNETSDDRISVRIDAQANEPRLSLRDFSVSMAQISPGDSFSISAQLVNLGEGAAYNVQAAIAEELPEGVFLAGNQNAPFFHAVEPGSQNAISFAFQLSNSISSGTFPILFEVIGRDQAGEEISEPFRYFVTVVAPPGGYDRAFISISTSTPGGVIGVNGQMPIYLQVTNTGSLPANRIEITATPTDTEAIVPLSASVQTIPILEPGATEAVQFVFSPTNDAGSHYHMVGFEVTYYTGIKDETDSFAQFVGMNVYNPDEDEDRRSRPRMLVSSYSVYPMIVSAGNEFDLTLTFQNTSSDQSVHNIKVTLEAVEHEERFGAVFTTVGASNTIFIDSLGPREESEHALRMFTVPNADPRTYNIEIIFEYENSDFEELTESEQISIPVRQVTRLEVNNVNIPPQATMFQPVFVDFNIINSGRVTLGNLRVEMQGNFDTSGMNIWAGNMGRGNNASFSGNFIPEEPGEQHGVLIVSGEDETFELIEVRHEFVIFVDEMPMWDDEMIWDDDMRGWDDGMDMPGGGFPILPWIGGGAAVVAIGAGGAIYLIRKRRNNIDIFENLQ